MVVHSRVPELESHIIMLTSNVRHCEEGLRAKDRQMEEKDRRINELRRQIEDYNLIDRSNIELLTNNRSLLAEIDKLYALLRNRTQEFDHVRSDNDRLLALPSMIQELTKRIEHLDLEVDEKSREAKNYKAQTEDLWLRLEEAKRFNDRTARDNENYEQEYQLWRAKLEEEERRHRDIVDELKREIVIKQRAAAEEVRNEILEGFRQERHNLESRVDDLTRKLKDYEGKILALTEEIEKLNEGLADKIEQLTDKMDENSVLKRELYTRQKQIDEVRSESEIDRREELENVRNNLISTFSQEQETLEDEIKKLRIELGEIERLKRASEVKDTEIQSLNRIIRDQEERNKSRIDELNQLWEGKTKLAVEREVRELGSKFVSERGDLEQELRTAKLNVQKLEDKLELQNEEIKRLTSWNETKNQEIINLKDQSAKKELTHQKEFTELKKTHQDEIKRELGQTGDRIQQEAEKEIAKVNKKNENLEAKVLALADELSKLANTNEDQFSEVEQLRLKLRGMEHRHETELKELRATIELEARLKSERDLAEVRAGSDREFSALENKYKSAEQARKTLEARCEFLDQDRNKLSEENNSLQKQTLELRQKQRELELSKNQELDTLRKQFEVYKQAGAELDQYRGKYDTLVKDLNNTRERANDTEIERNREVQNLKKELVEIESRHYREKRDLEEQLEEERRNSMDLRELQIRFGSEKAGYENKIRQLKTIGENGKQEMEKLYDLLNQRKKEHEANLKQNEELRKQVDKLQKQLKSYEDSGNLNEGGQQGRPKDDELLEKVEELEKEKKFFREQAERYSSQLESKKEELQDRNREIDDLKNVYESSLQKMGVDLDKFNAGHR